MTDTKNDRLDGDVCDRTRCVRARRVCLNDSLFEKYLERFVDENKPDPLMKRQIESWRLVWNEKGKTKEGGEGEDEEFTLPLSVAFEPTNIIQGTLQWACDSEYLVVDVHTLCCWAQEKKHDDDNEQSGKKGDSVSGHFYFSLRCEARFKTKSEMKDDDKKGKVSSKVRSKMFKRLRDDAYISRVLTKEVAPVKASPKPNLLCEAMIYIQENQSAKTEHGKTTQNVDNENSNGKLEEKVFISDDDMEGLRRSIFSKSEDVLDLIEIVVGMPFLPGKAYASASEFAGKSVLRNGTNRLWSPLADRAKLRLLEDAMYDACDKEDEQELINELNITPDIQQGGQQQNTSDNGSKKAKRSKHN